MAGRANGKGPRVARQESRPCRHGVDTGRRLAYALRMGDTTDWLNVLLMLCALAICAPWAIRVLRSDRRVPHYIALWLGIGLLLGLVYEFFGPFR